MAQRPVSFLNTILVINGVEITGWSEGDDVIQMKRRVDAFSDKVGAGGDMMVSLSADRSGEVTFKLQRTSPSNVYLGNLARSQQAAGGATFVPITLLAMDTYRQDKGIGSGGYLRKLPDASWGAMAGDYEWSIIVQSLDMLFGTDVLY